MSDKRKYNLVDTYFQDSGPYAREYYLKHIYFFSAGATHTRRAFIAGNRIGKTLAGGYEIRCHMTGKYPHWWEGKRFTRPVNVWIAGLTTVVIRESIQELLFGNFSDKGTGLFSKDDITDEKGDFMTWAMPGTPNCVGTALINYISGGKSKVEFKSYDQGWEKFQGAKRDIIWLDEEPSDPKIYDECSTRTAGDKGKEGILYCTFTPLQGYSTIVLGFLPNGIVPKDGVHPENIQKIVICAGWNDVPHLSEDWKAQQLLEYGPNDRDARSKGIPSMGSGRIFPVEEDQIVCKPFQIPDYFTRCYGMDFGWHKTAVVWIAQDPTTKIRYVYAEYKDGKKAPYIHAHSIKARGQWLTGGCDPSGGGINSKDGTKLVDEYRSLGLKLEIGENGIQSGIAKLLNAFESGSLKIFRNLEHLLTELRVYRYDINKPNEPARNQEDHLLDALKYGDSIFDQIAISEEDAFDCDESSYDYNEHNCSRDPDTGY